MKNAKEIIELLGSASKTAQFFEVKQQSVVDWLDKNTVPEDRLVRYAARLEAATGFAFSRRTQWPATYATIWPELANTEQSTPHVSAAPSVGAMESAV